MERLLPERPPMSLLLAFAVAIAPARAQTGEAETHIAEDRAELPPVPPPPDPERAPVHESVVASTPSERGARPVGLVAAGAATTAAMFGVEVVAVLIAISGCDFFGPGTCVETGLAAATAITASATLALVPLVVWATGESLGGRGGYGSTFLGHLLGALAWFAVPAVALIEADDLLLPAILFAGLSESVGAAIGYELSSPR